MKIYCIIIFLSKSHLLPITFSTDIFSHDWGAAFAAGVVTITMISFAFLMKLKPQFLKCSKEDLDKDLSGKHILITGANSGIYSNFISRDRNFSTVIEINKMTNAMNCF